jgi:hypothetical protein
MMTANELIQKIYDENYSHFEFMENMNGGDCDCYLHITLDTMFIYLEVPADTHWNEVNV